MACECLIERTKNASMLGKLCTLIFIGLWFLELCALILAHQGISLVIDPITDLPVNLINSFNTELGIGNLESGMQIVQAQSELVLAKCNLDPVSCADIIAGGTDPSQDPPNTDTANADVEKAAIVQAFDDGLAKAKKVVTDKYFGMASMQEAASGLTEISDQLEAAEGGDQPCLAQNAIYCAMREAAIQTLGGVTAVNDAIDGFTENDMMVRFEEQVAPQLGLLHIVPYVFILSLGLFTAFWASDSAGKCCASKLGVCAYLFHLIFTIVGTVIAGVVVVAYLAAGPGADRISFPAGFFATDGANLQIIKDHIATEFPELWATVFEPFGVAGGSLGRAFMVFLAVGIITLLYGILVCIIRPYKKKEESAEGGAGEGK